MEQLSESSIIMHQIFKRVWPSSQRDTVFLSHIREIPLSDAGKRVENEVGRPWIVCNNSMEHQDAPVLVVAEIFYVKLFETVVQFFVLQTITKVSIMKLSTFIYSETCGCFRLGF